MQLANGYKAYRAAWAPHLLAASNPANRIRQIQLWDDFFAYYGVAKTLTNTYEPALPGRPRKPSSLVSTRDDPVLEGQDMAAEPKWNGVVDGVRTTGRGVKVSGDLERKELADLRRLGLLYDEEEMEIGDVVRRKPAYVVKHVAGRGGWEDVKATHVQGDVEVAGECDVEDMAGETVFVPESDFERWTEFAESNGFDVVMVDDLVSNAESWAEVDKAY